MSLVLGSEVAPIGSVHHSLRMPFPPGCVASSDASIHRNRGNIARQPCFAERDTVGQVDCPAVSEMSDGAFHGR
ncbi:MAG: hypothetical protein FLDDKLPJ_03328 [Phycisphaerae bacterium]|nr:hypothetical protein [Phycisphaerae bacterium]